MKQSNRVLEQRIPNRAAQSIGFRVLHFTNFCEILPSFSITEPTAS
jgi:hypothetical protein